jgi:hypothetical protein
MSDDHAQAYAICGGDPPDATPVLLLDEVAREARINAPWELA